MQGQMSLFDFYDETGTKFVIRTQDEKPKPKKLEPLVCSKCKYHSYVRDPKTGGNVRLTCGRHNGCEYEPMPMIDEIWDDDMRYFNELISNLTDRCGYQNGETSFYIWHHCPQYGYRLTHEVIVTQGNPHEEAFRNELDQIIEEAKARSIELDPMWGAVYFFGKGEKASLPIYGEFTDNRKKIKKEGD